MGVGVMWIKCLVQYLAHCRCLIIGINSCLFGSVELDVLIVCSLPKFGMLALPTLPHTPTSISYTEIFMVG